MDANLTRVRDLPDWYDALQRAPEHVADGIDERTAPRPWYYPSQVGGSLLVAVLAMAWIFVVVPLAGFERAYTTHPLRGPVTWLFGVYELFGGVVLLPLAVVLTVAGAVIAAVCFPPYLVAWTPVALARRALGRAPARAEQSTAEGVVPDIWTILFHWEYGEAWVQGIVVDAAATARDHLDAGRYARGLLRFVAGWAVVLLATVGYGLLAVVFVFFYLLLLGFSAVMFGVGASAVVDHPLVDPATRAGVALPTVVAAVSFAARYFQALRGQ